MILMELSKLCNSVARFFVFFSNYDFKFNFEKVFVFSCVCSSSLACYLLVFVLSLYLSIRLFCRHINRQIY